MATFSTNQARQLYVATATNNTTFPGSAKKECIYLTQTNATGEAVRSDLIKVDNIISAKYTPAAKMARALKAVTLTLDPTVNGGQPIAGEDYITHINFRQYASLGDQDTYVKHGMVHAYKDMTPSQFYATLALSLAKNFSRELTKLVEIRLGVADADSVVVEATDKLEDLTEDYDSVIIAEVPQEWTRGIKAQVPVYFDVVPTTVISDGDEMVWGKVEEGTDGTVGNGKLIADLEYFCMGERGDIYRNIGWPNSIPTKYLVDETKEYDVIDIHYAYVGSNESVQKSEKTLTIVGESTALAAVKTALQTVSGLTL